MKYISARQLAFVLNLKTIGEAKKMIAVANAKEKGLTVDYKTFEQEKHPTTLEIDVVSRNLNLPNLQAAVDDIHENYMKRPATRGYILNLPRERIQKELADQGSAKLVKANIKLKIPAELSDFLSNAAKDEIMKIWKERYSEFSFIEF